MRRAVVLVVLVVLSAAGSLSAHHSFSPIFDASKEFTLTGTLTKLDWRNPHIALFVEAMDDRGQAEDWVMETEAPRVFQNRNISKTDFQKAIGRPVTVQGYRARDGSRYGWIQQITLPGGKLVTPPPPAALAPASR